MKHKIAVAIEKISKYSCVIFFLCAGVALLTIGFLPAMSIWSAGLFVQGIGLTIVGSSEDGSRQAFLLRCIGAAIATVLLATWNTPVVGYETKYNIVVFCYALIILCNNHDSVTTGTEILIRAVRKFGE